MELLSTEFLAALAAIVIIDLVLAGDNAIVIALAARSLPRHLQRRAIVWGAGGAIVVRSAMTLAVVWLLQIPGLLLAGGLLLIWIAYRLLSPEDADNGSGHAPAATTFWGAMKTIVIADAVMGLDNVLAVAGAAHGSYLLVVLGLLISVPIVIWGSTLILTWVERFPAIVYLGAGVLAWTAVKMMVAEPLLQEPIAAYPVAVPLLYLSVIGAVLWAGFLRNHRRLESRISARLVVLARQREIERSATVSSEGDRTMQRILVPVDGSRNAEHAVRHVIAGFLQNPAVEIHLLNVQAPLSRHVSQFIRRRTREEFHLDEAEKALAPARALLDQHRIPHATHVKLGERAKAIADEARRLRCHQIVMGTARKNSLTRMLQDSVTNRVLEQTTVPVEIIAGDEVSKLERYGVPAGLGAALAWLIVAID